MVVGRVALVTNGILFEHQPDGLVKTMHESRLLICVDDIFEQNATKREGRLGRNPSMV